MKRCFALMMMILLCRAGVPQTAADQARQLAGQTLVLRGFSADTSIHGRWDGTTVVEETPKFREVSRLAIKSVKVSSQAVQVKGHRLLFGLDAKGQPAMIDEHQNVTIDVAFDPAQAEQALAGLRDALFYGNDREAWMDLPEDYRKNFVGLLVPASMAEGHPASCDCSKCPDIVGSEAEGWHRPALIYSVDPDYSEEAQKRKVNASVTIGFTLDTSGRPTDLWVLLPAPAGLDDSAMATVRQYRFKPATCHDLPVASRMSIDISFQIF